MRRWEFLAGLATAALVSVETSGAAKSARIGKAKDRGVYSIEFEGSGDPRHSVENVVRELSRYR